MSDEEVVPGALEGTATRARRWLTTGQFGLGTRTWQALVAVSVVALLARLVGLGYRPMHFDEGRVAYWALRYAKTGTFEYRYIVHGPLIQHVDRWLFVLLGANDFVARLPVALVGGLLPLSVVLYRDHLRESELLALAVLLTVNPIMLYYSRFMRSDMLVAAFMFVALGLLLRLHATRDPRYLHAATAAMALGFASKENAVVYLLAWGGAAALLVDTALFRAGDGRSGIQRVREGVHDVVSGRGRELARRWGGHGLLTVLLFLVLTLLLFAPRAGSAGGVGLWKSLTRPTMVPALLWETGRDIAHGMGYWFGGAVEDRCFEETWLAGYRCFLERYLRTMWQFAASLSLLAVLGVVAERYAAADPRNLVMFAGYWGVASVVGYPLGMDIWAAWPVMHALVPLAIPAAVALGWLFRFARGAAADRDVAGAAASGLLVVLLVGYSGAVAVEASYLDARDRDSETDMVQYAQPSGDMRPGLRAMRAAVAGNDGLDVVYYGDRYDLHNESAVALPPPRDAHPNHTTGAWFDRLPLPWYTEAFDASVASTSNASGLDRLLARSPAIVVAARADADDVAERLDGYERYGPYNLRAHLNGPGRYTSVVIFVRTSS